MKTAHHALLTALWAFLLAASAFAEDPGGPIEKTVLLNGSVSDASNSIPIACTVSIFDSSNRLMLDGQAFAAGFRCDGRFSKRLSPGKTRIRISRGFEFVAQEQTLDLSPGAAMNLEFRLKRRVSLRSRGWYSGDSHAHMIHGENTLPVDFASAALAARAEDLQYLCVAQAWPMTNPSPEKLEKELGRVSVSDCVLAWNLEAPKNYYQGDAGQCLGHCWTLGLKGRSLAGVDAIASLLQASAHDYESEKPRFANFESHRFIHDQAGAVFYSHPARWWTGAWGGKGGYPKKDRMRISNMAVELPLDTLIGPTYDGLDVMTSAGELEANAKAFELWCLLLNHGYRLAATASSDSCFDRPGGATPGSVRTYTYLDEPFSIPAVARATARGRTFATSGPLIVASLDNQPPGSVLPAGSTQRRLSIEAWAGGNDAGGLVRLDLLRNGVSFRTLEWRNPCMSVATNIDLIEKEDAWYSVQLFGSGPKQPRAFTSAFYFETSPNKCPKPEQARVSVTLVDRDSGTQIEGSVMEVFYSATLAADGQRHSIPNGLAVITVPGMARLRAEAPGYTPLCLSPFLDCPELLNSITRLSAEDLLRWETFEHIRSLLGRVRLTFPMEKIH